MKIFHSNMIAIRDMEKFLGEESVDILTAYPDLQKLGTAKKIRRPSTRDIFLDSGAFAAYKCGFDIDVHEYAEFVQKEQDDVFVAAGLDVIGDAEATLRNQEILDGYGIETLPAYHYGEPSSFLRHYAETYNYIALGGIAQLGSNRKAVSQWLGWCFSIILDTDPTTKVHGYAIQDEKLLMAFPWYSVDARSAHIIGCYGGIYTPWGTFKINKDVKADYLKWKMPLGLPIVSREEGRIKEYVDEVGQTFLEPITYDEMACSGMEATIRRCAWNIRYFDSYANFVCHNPHKPRKGFGLFK